MSRQGNVFLYPIAVLITAVLALPVSADELKADQLSDAAFPAAPLSLEQLGAASGRQGVPVQLQLNENQQHAAVRDNSLSGNVLTGNNSISDHAFEHMSGIATVIQNTGNQVVIQDSTMINVLINH